jgi:hypothetical protein
VRQEPLHVPPLNLLRVAVMLKKRKTALDVVEALL